MAKMRSRLSQAGDLWRAIGFGLLVTGAFFILFVVPAVILAPPTSESVIAAYLSSAQVYTGFIGIFLASALGFFAIREFMEAQARPDLRLSFFMKGTEPVTERYTVRISDQEPAPIAIAVHNRGLAAATWFQVQISLPYARSWALWHQREGREVPYGAITDLTQAPEGGPHYQRHWRFFLDEDGNVGLTFMSRGEMAAFPDWPLRLTGLRIPHDPRYGWPKADEYSCEYSIVSDQSRLVSGVLYLTIEADPDPS